MQKNVCSLKHLSGGRNSKVCRLNLENSSESYVVKIYYRQVSDGRDRLNVEYEALSFLWKNGIRSIPRPVAVYPEKGYAFYEYIAGENIDCRRIKKSDLIQAVDFLRLLKDLSKSKESDYLPAASEACFTIRAVCQNLEQRIAQLVAVEDRLLQTFLKNELLPAYSQVLEKTDIPGHKKLPADRPLTKNEKTLSPSDFGFHNAIKDKTGRIYFLDFEYFGWDDPAKTICDFMLHPAMQLTSAENNIFYREAVAVYKDLDNLEQRVNTVYPLYALKWSIILLNEFLPENYARRSFAGEETVNYDHLLKEQLYKAKKMLEKVVNSDGQYPGQQ